MEIWIPIVIGIVCLAAGFAGGYVYRRNIAEAKIASRVFKAHEGMSPSQYLKQLKK